MKKCVMKWSVVLVFFLVNGCSTVGDWLSGPSLNPSVWTMYGQNLHHITLGVTTQAKVREVFGPPKDIQTSVKKGIREETWAYATANSSVNPFQYLPIIGVLALPSTQDTDAMSISFSSEGIVDGVSVRDVQPYGSAGETSRKRQNRWAIESYGMNNPMVRIKAR